MALPGYPGLHPTVRVKVLEALMDCALTPDSFARVVVAERLLDFRAFLIL